MTSLVIVATAVVAALIASELVLRGTKLQTGLRRVLGAWAAAYVPAALLLWRFGDVGVAAFTIFWGGAFLSWFGVRSHIESSILLKMLYLLRRQPMPEDALVERYVSQEGEDARREELLRGGLAGKSGDKVCVTPKGKAVLGVVARLR